MPQNFLDKSQPQSQSRKDPPNENFTPPNTAPNTAPNAAPNVTSNTIHNIATKPPRKNAAEILSEGLSPNELDILKIIRDEITATDFIPNFMFNDQASVTIKINKHVSVSFRSPSSAEQEDIEAYLYGKDPYKIFAEKDGKEIAELLEDRKLTSPEAKDIFLRSFPKSTAEARYAKVYLAAVMLKLNGKPLGKNICDRFTEIAKLPLYLFSQIYSNVGLFERAVKIELVDEGAIKN